MKSIEEFIAALKQLPPDERARFLDLVRARLAEAEYMKRQMEYDLQEEQRSKLDRKRIDEGDDYGMPEYTP
jgi:hypothetical protein